MIELLDGTAMSERTLEDLEVVVERGLQTFVEVGSALAEIRQRRLYRDQYDTFEAYCQDRWGFNRKRASQLIQAAEVSNMLDKPLSNARQARELAPLLNEPEMLREVAAQVREVKGDKATARDYATAVEQVRPKATAIGRAARSATRTAVTESLTRPSVSSKAEPGDCADDAPDYTEQSQETPDADRIVVNNEPMRGGRPKTTYCDLCGDYYQGEVCPCASVPPPMDGGSGETPPAPLTSRGPSEAIDGADSAPMATAGEVQPQAMSPGPPALPESASQESAASNDTTTDSHGRRSESSTTSTKGGSHSVTAHGFPAGRTMDTGDLTRALLGQPTAQIIEALAENTTPAQRQALREAFGPVQQPADVPAPARIDLREALGDDGCTILALSTAIGETFTVDARASLLALLADAMPAERLGPLAHRLTVRVKNTGDLIDPEPIADVSLAAVRASILALTSAEIRSLESELPLIRKEVGARERADQKATA